MQVLWDEACTMYIFHTHLFAKINQKFSLLRCFALTSCRRMSFEEEVVPKLSPRLICLSHWKTEKGLDRTIKICRHFYFYNFPSQYNASLKILLFSRSIEAVFSQGSCRSSHRSKSIVSAFKKPATTSQTRCWPVSSSVLHASPESSFIVLAKKSCEAST